MADVKNRRSYTYDNNLLMKDAGLVAASAAAQVASAAKILDLGGAEPFMGVLVVDTTAVEEDSTNEEFIIIVQGSNASDFSSGVENLAALDLGYARKGGAQASGAVGRYELPFLNVAADTAYRYLRVYTFVAGTVATGINYTAFIGKLGVY